MPFIKNISVQKSKSAAAPQGSNCAVGAGTNYSLDLYANGLVWAWGTNPSGNLGDNSITQRNTPVSIAGARKTFCTINGGDSFVLAIDNKGRAWAWGLNLVGQLGDNTIISKRTPVSVAGAVKTFCKIAGGSSFSAAIDKNGQVWAWGNNPSGQLGDNTIVSKRTPVSIVGTAKTFCEIAVGASFAAAIDKNGLVWAWGSNLLGQLGDNSITQRNTPVSILGTLKTFCKIAAQTFFTIAIDKNGKVWGWGDNTYGQLGDNTLISKRTPVSILGAAKTFCKIESGGSNVVAIDKNGQVWTWGYNNAGQLGDGGYVSKRTPVSIGGVKKTFCQIGAGVSHVLAIDKNGNTWAWGYNQTGQLGINIDGANKCTPVSVAGTAKTFCEISAGGAHTIAISNNSGKVWGWGNSFSGQTGNPSFANNGLGNLTPVSIVGTNVFCQIKSGGSHNIAIDQFGLLWGWGSNSFGELGDNTVTNRCSPVSVAGVAKTFCKIGTGASHTVAIDQNGQVWAWGVNTSGQLGDNTIISKRTPVSILGARKTFCQIGSGGNTVTLHTITIEYTGKDLWAWGSNGAGQLGDRTITNKCTPVKVYYPNGVSWPNTLYNGKIALGGAFTVVLDDVGQVWTWGFNSGGQLGDNTVTNKCTPVSIAGVAKKFCEISAGTSYALAIDDTGQVWGWGVNVSGQLGDNSASLSRRTPVSVAGAKKTFCKIAAGGTHSTAIDYTGKVWSWGLNTSSQLGNNALYRNTPVRVCNI